jgi:hypothetical protein
VLIDPLPGDALTKSVTIFWVQYFQIYFTYVKSQLRGRNEYFSRVEKNNYNTKAAERCPRMMEMTFLSTTVTHSRHHWLTLTRKRKCSRDCNQQYLCELRSDGWKGIQRSTLGWGSSRDMWKRSITESCFHGLGIYNLCLVRECLYFQHSGGGHHRVLLTADWAIKLFTLQ